MEKTLKGCRAVVIGAGIAGLATAISLAARGARVRILEQAAVAGGRHASIRLGNVDFELSDEVLTQPQVLGDLFGVADLRLAEFLTLHPVEPRTRLVFPDGMSCDLYRDPFKLAEEISRFSQRDAERLARALRAGEAQGHRIEYQFLSRPGRGMAGVAMAALRPTAWRAVAPILFPVSLDRWLRWRFESRAVRELFAALLGAQGMTLLDAPAGTGALVALELQQGAWMPDGGMSGLVSALLRVATLLNIQVMTGCTVERIEWEASGVRGVSGEGFKPLRADIVVSTLGSISTSERLVPGPPHTPRLPAKAGRSAMALFLLLRGRCDKLERLETLFVDEDPIETRRQLDTWRVPAASPPLRVVRPGVIRKEFDAPGRTGIKVLVSAPAPSMRYRWSDATSSRARDEILRRLSAAGIDGVPEMIEEQALLTPSDLGRRFRHTGGALYDPRPGGGCRWLLRAGNRLRGVHGLYLAGGGAHPGPGIAGHLRSGMLAAEYAARDWRFRA